MAILLPMATLPMAILLPMALLTMPILTMSAGLVLLTIVSIAIVEVLVSSTMAILTISAGRFRRVFDVTQQTVLAVNDEVRRQELRVRSLARLCDEVSGMLPLEQLLVPSRELVGEVSAEITSSCLLLTDYMHMHMLRVACGLHIAICYLRMSHCYGEVSVEIESPTVAAPATYGCR